MMRTPMLTKVSTASVPTEWGTFDCTVFSDGDVEHLAFVRGRPTDPATFRTAQSNHKIVINKINHFPHCNIATARSRGGGQNSGGRGNVHHPPYPAFPQNPLATDSQKWRDF